ncbi:hypothetical protein CEE37_09040 [candidate division LCP-89 bacterium B3_LCP]|uniref:Uncharacterized protein n=1 Tax=candidate division LCP-89 bacterium B3_LCP TaxID=2012998 RepID=A0A532UZZ2_UNCL8|nr:MAG: hypothetical protein CEE37_09040 [candidate division LCP-89 bacterium B3_LCP]
MYSNEEMKLYNDNNNLQIHKRKIREVIMNSLIKSLVMTGLLVAILALHPSITQANPPVNFQGILEENGQPAHGTYAFVFAIFSQETGGASVWSETDSVQVDDGIYNVILGETTTLETLDFSQNDYWMEITVAAVTLTPRQRITYSMASMWAAEAESVPPGAIGTLEIADDAVTSAKIADGTITAFDIATDAVESDEILDGTITGLDIAAGAVSNSELANNAVNSDKIEDGTIMEVDLGFTAGIGDITAVTAGDGLTGGGTSGDVTLESALGTSIDTDEIVDGTITAFDIALGAVTTTEILDGTIAMIDLGPDVSMGGDITAVTAGDGLTGGGTSGDVTLESALGTSIDTDEIVDETITGLDIAEGAISNSELEADAVTTDEILNGTILEEDLDPDIEFGDITAVIAGDGLTGGGVSGDVTLYAVLGTSIGTNELEGNSVGSGKIQNGAVHNVDLGGSAVTSDKILDGTITMDDLGFTVGTGDITAVIAGDGLTGGGTSGDVTLVSVLGTSIGNSELENDAVTEDNIASGVVSSDKIAYEGVMTDNIDTGAVTSDKIAYETVSTDNIAADAITSDKIMDGNISISDLQNPLNLDSGIWQIYGSGTWPTMDIRNNSTGFGDVLHLTSNAGTSVGTYVLGSFTVAGNAGYFAKDDDDGDWCTEVWSTSSTSSGDGLYVYGRAVATAGWGLDVVGGDGSRRELPAVYSETQQVHLTGSATLSQGRATVSFDRSTSGMLANGESPKVFLTPRNGWSGLYVESSSTSGFAVRSGAGDANISFDWLAIAQLGENKITKADIMSPEELAKLERMKNR